MNVTVFGANGKVGQKVVEKLLENNHKVVAFVHGSNSFTEYKNLKVIQGDIHNLAHVEGAVAGSDAIISALGSWGTKSKDIVSSGIKNIVPAAQKHGVKRIISLTGAGAYYATDKFSLLRHLERTFAKIVAGKILEDGEKHIRILKESDLNWTVVRSPVMKENGKQNDFILSNVAPKPWVTIQRDDVAKAMVVLAESNNWNKQSPFIRRK